MKRINAAIICLALLSLVLVAISLLNLCSASPGGFWGGPQATQEPALGGEAPSPTVPEIPSALLSVGILIAIAVGAAVYKKLAQNNLYHTDYSSGSVG